MLQVAVDDNQHGWANLGGGQSMGADLLPGAHTLYVGWGEGDYFSYDFEIEHEQSLNATVTFGKGVSFE